MTARTPAPDPARVTIAPLALHPPQILWPLAAELGEGPVWADGALWLVDIKRRQVHRLDPASGERRSWDSPEFVGFVLPRAGGGFVAGLKSGLHAFDPADGSFRPLIPVEPGLPDNRLNDATVAPDGRLWFGTMDNLERQASGRFYRAQDGRADDAGLAPVTITNGPAFSPDGRTIYFVDTLGQTIHAADVADGMASNPRLFATIDEGHPDGPTVDSEGCVWIALYGGWSARRYSPSGELLGDVRFPVANITKLAFGGVDLRTVFATTARQGLSPEALARQPDAGAVFAFEVGTPGLPAVPASL